MDIKSFIDVTMGNAKTRDEAIRLYLSQKRDANDNLLEHVQNTGYDLPHNDVYEKYGLQQNNWEYLDPQLAQLQSNWTKAGNSFMRTTVGEILLGTTIGFSDLFDMFTGGIFTEHAYGKNFIGTALKKGQEAIDEEFKIYRDQNKNITNGGLYDFGWWTDMFPSVASSIALLLPAKAVSGGVLTLGSKIAKAARMKNASKADKALHNLVNSTGKAVETGEMGAVEGGNALRSLANDSEFNRKLKAITDITLTAGASRLMENYQEAGQTYDENLTLAIDHLNSLNESEFDEVKQNLKLDSSLNKQQVAEYVATSAADEAFAVNMANFTFDIVQYAALRSMWKNTFSQPINNALNKAQKSAITEFAEKSAEAATKGIGKKLLNGISKVNWKFVAAESTEGIEEIVNYVAQQEGNHLAKQMLNVSKDDKTRNERIKDYFKDGQLWDSAFWGWMGGLLFGAVGESMMRKLQYGTFKDIQTQSRIDNVKRNQQNYSVLLSTIAAIDNNKELTDEQKAEEKENLINDYISQMAIDSANSGNLSLFTDFINNEDVKKQVAKNLNISEEELAEWNDKVNNIIQKTNGLYDKNIKKIRKAISDFYLEDNLDFQLLPQFISAIAAKNTSLELRGENILSDITKLQGEINEHIAEHFDNDANFSYFAPYYNALYNAYQIKKMRYENNLDKETKIGDKTSKDDNTERIDKFVSDYLKDATPIEKAWYKLVDKNYTYEDGNFIGDISSFTADDFKAIDENLSDEEINSFIGQSKTLSNFAVNANLERANVLLFEDNSTPFSTLDNKYRQVSALQAAKNYVDHSKITSAKDILNYLRHAHADVDSAVRSELKNVKNEAKDFIKSYAKEHNVNLKTATEFLTQAMYDIAKDNDSIRDNEVYNDLSDSDITKLQEIVTKAKAKGIIYPKYNKKFDALDEIGYIIRYLDEIDELNKENTKSNNEKTVDPKDLNNPEYAEEKETPEYMDLTKPVSFGTANALISYDVELNDIDDDENTVEAISYDNKDLIVKANRPSDIANNELYDKIARPSTNTPIYVASYPVLKYNPVTKKYDVIRKGKLTLNENEAIDNTPVEESNNPPVADESKSPVTEDGNNATDASQPGDNEKDLVEEEKKLIAAVRNADSSTGELSKEDEEEAKKIGFAIIKDEKFAEDYIVKIYALYSSIFTDKYNQYEDTISKEDGNTLNEVIERIIGEVEEEVKKLSKALGISSSLVETAMNSKRSDIMMIYGEDIDDDLSENGFASVLALIATCRDNCIVASNMNKESDDLKNAYSALDSAIRRLLEKYVKTKKCNVVDGVAYIDISDVLQYVQNIQSATEDDLYNVIANYIVKSDKYETVSDLGQPRTTINEAISRKYKEKNSTNLTANGIIEPNGILRINLIEILHNLNTNEEVESFWKNFDKLSVNDKVNITLFSRDNTLVISTGKYGSKSYNPIGTLTIPEVLETGEYSQINDDWKYIVSKKTDGSITSNLKDIFMSWLDTNNTNPFAIEINKILHQLAFKHLSEKERNALIAQLAQNAEFNAIATDDNYTVKHESKNTKDVYVRDYNKLVNHLTKLLKYSRSSSEAYTDPNMAFTYAMSLEFWFTKVYDNYEKTVSLANALATNKTVTAEINTIFKGQALKTADATEHQPVSKAYVGYNAQTGLLSNPNGLRLSYAQSNGTIYISGVSEAVTQKKDGGVYVVKNMPFVVMPTKGGTERQYINVSGLSASKSKEMIAVKNHLHKLFDAYEIADKVKKQKIAADIMDFMASVLGQERPSIFKSKNNSKIISSSELDSNTKTLTHTINHIGGKILSIRTTTGFTTKKAINGVNSFVNINAKEAKDILDEFLDTLVFNVDYNYVIADGKQDETILEGLANYKKKRKNSKAVFTITIGNEVFEYESYNDFLIGNDHIKIGLKQENGSNYNRNPQNTSLQPSVTIKYDIETTTNKSIRDKVKDLFKDGKAVDGTTIFELVANEFEGDDALNFIKTNKKDLFILPKKVIFVEDKNNRVNKDRVAQYKINTNTCEIGNNFLDLIENPESRVTGIAQLIHEELHHRFRDAKYADKLKEIQSIYDEFVEALKDPNVVLNINKEYTLHEFEKIDESERLEEFVTHTLTVKNLAEALNSIESKTEFEEKKSSSRNLFRRLINALLDFFGIDVNKKSLYYKQYLTLSGLLSNESSNSSTEETANASEETAKTEENDEENSENDETDAEEDEEDETDDDAIQINDNDEEFEEEDFGSSLSIVNNDNMSISNIINSVPIEQRADFASLIERGEIETICR